MRKVTAAIILMCCFCFVSCKNGSKNKESEVEVKESIEKDINKNSISKEYACAYFLKSYHELLEFKNNTDFQKYGFGDNSPYKYWINNINRIDSRDFNEHLVENKFVVGDLKSLGYEYVKTNGKENESTKILNKLFSALSDKPEFSNYQAIIEDFEKEFNDNKILHLTFEGIQLDGKLSDFIEKMQEIGYSLSEKEIDYAEMKGRFDKDKNCEISIYGSNKTNNVWQVVVWIPSNKNLSISEQVKEYSNKYTSKYNNPNIETDNSVTWELDYGRIRITSEKVGKDSYILIYYIDKINYIQRGAKW